MQLYKAYKKKIGIKNLAEWLNAMLKNFFVIANFWLQMQKASKNRLLQCQKLITV